MTEIRKKREYGFKSYFLIAFYPSGFQRGSAIVIPNLLPQNSFDKVLPRLFLGDQRMGLDPRICLAQGITHVLNAAQGTKFGKVNTDESLFLPHDIRFMGIPANDNMGESLIEIIRIIET